MSYSNEQIELASQQGISEDELIEMTEDINSFCSSVCMAAEEFEQEVMYS